MCLIFRGVHKFTNQRRKQDTSDCSVQLSSFPTSFGLVLKNDPPKPLAMAASAAPKKFRQRVSEQHGNSYSQMCLISYSGNCLNCVTLGLLSSLDVWMHSFQYWWTLFLLEKSIPSGPTWLHLCPQIHMRVIGYIVWLWVYCVSLGTLHVCFVCSSFSDQFFKEAVCIIPFQNVSLHWRVKQLKPKFLPWDHHPQPLPLGC